MTHAPRHQRLISQIERGARILIDGATGTELERRGVPELDNAWTGGAALSHPEVLRSVHEDYLNLGAQIVIANTFSTTRHALADAGREGDFDALNRRGVEIAVDARDRCGAAGSPGDAPGDTRGDALVAGGISYWSWTGDHPPLEVLHADVTRQARVMAKAGADLLMLEMMVDIDRMLVTLEAAQASGLPVWVGLTCEPDRSGHMCLRNGEALEDALAALDGRDVPVLSVMHSNVVHIDGALDIVQRHWDGPLGVYAHAGGHDGEAWVEENLCPPERFADLSLGWLDRGVHVIGGCCGMGVAHMRALAARMKSARAGGG